MSMISVKPELCSVLNDPATHSNEAWTAISALDQADRTGVTSLIAPGLAELTAASGPTEAAWLADRLTVMWSEFMASRPPKSPQALALWMGERIRLLGEYPQDILAHALDAAVKRSPHGFIPSIGEICSIAEPLACDRRRQVRRLRAMVAAMASDETTAELDRRRRLRTAVAMSSGGTK